MERYHAEDTLVSVPGAEEEFIIKEYQDDILDVAPSGSSLGGHSAGNIIDEDESRDSSTPLPISSRPSSARRPQSGGSTRSTHSRAVSTPTWDVNIPVVVQDLFEDMQTDEVVDEALKVLEAQSRPRSWASSYGGPSRGPIDLEEYEDLALLEHPEPTRPWSARTNSTHASELGKPKRNVKSAGTRRQRSNGPVRVAPRPPPSSRGRGRGYAAPARHLTVSDGTAPMTRTASTPSSLKSPTPETPAILSRSATPAVVPEEERQATPQMLEGIPCEEFTPNGVISKVIPSSQQHARLTKHTAESPRITNLLEWLGELQRVPEYPGLIAAREAHVRDRHSSPWYTHLPPSKIPAVSSHFWEGNEKVARIRAQDKAKLGYCPQKGCSKSKVHVSKKEQNRISTAAREAIERTRHRINEERLVEAALIAMRKSGVDPNDENYEEATAYLMTLARERHGLSPWPRTSSAMSGGPGVSRPPSQVGVHIMEMDNAYSQGDVMALRQPESRDKIGTAATPALSNAGNDEQSQTARGPRPSSEASSNKLNTGDGVTVNIPSGRESVADSVSSAIVTLPAAPLDRTSSVLLEDAPGNSKNVEEPESQLDAKPKIEHGTEHEMTRRSEHDQITDGDRISGWGGSDMSLLATEKPTRMAYSIISRSQKSPVPPPSYQRLSSNPPDIGKIKTKISTSTSLKRGRSRSLKRSKSTAVVERMMRHQEALKEHQTRLKSPRTSIAQATNIYLNAVMVDEIRVEAPRPRTSFKSGRYKSKGGATWKRSENKRIEDMTSVEKGVESEGATIDSIKNIEVLDESKPVTTETPEGAVTVAVPNEGAPFNQDRKKAAGYITLSIPGGDKGEGGQDGDPEGGAEKHMSTEGVHILEKFEITDPPPVPASAAISTVPSPRPETPLIVVPRARPASALLKAARKPTTSGGWLRRKNKSRPGDSFAQQPARVVAGPPLPTAPPPPLSFRNPDQVAISPEELELTPRDVSVLEASSMGGPSVEGWEGAPSLMAKLNLDAPDHFSSKSQQPGSSQEEARPRPLPSPGRHSRTKYLYLENFPVPNTARF